MGGEEDVEQLGKLVEVLYNELTETAQCVQRQNQHIRKLKEKAGQSPKRKFNVITLLMVYLLRDDRSVFSGFLMCIL